MPGIIQRYQKRVSGPILDRIDLHVDVPSVETQKLVERDRDRDRERESSKHIQKRVQAARDIQIKRFKACLRSQGTSLKSNSEMNTREVKEYCPLSLECRTMMISATASMNLSARSYFKVVKIARTIADLGSVKDISVNHLAEALQYRPKDTDY
jgi:magnesium chelatase family protein